MSALWVLGLGASIGYMIFKKQLVTSRLEQATNEYRKNRALPGQTPEGLTVGELHRARLDTSDTREKDPIFNERLPMSKRSQLVQGAKNMEREAQNYDANVDALNQGVPSTIEGVYCEMAVGGC